MSPGPEAAGSGDTGTKTPPQILLPLEERVTHFRDMLLERGVRSRMGSGGPSLGRRALALPH